MKDLRLLQKIVTSGLIATTAAFGTFVTQVQAANFSLPIKPAAKATGIDVLRDRYKLDGTGVTIGIISDSFATAETYDAFGNLDTYATNVAKGYLPSGVNVLKDYFGPDASDEGRALSQLIHAIAPGAKLAFYTGVEGTDSFGQGIQALAAAGADIIVDDIGYFPQDFPDAPPDFLDLEPPDGPINQAINAVFNQGVSYFTAAGNHPPDSIPIYGHANNPNALTIGAAYYGSTPTYFNRAFDTTIERGQLEPFSAWGGPNSLKPDVIAPDGLPFSFNLAGNSRLDPTPGFFSFFGTSASAPFTAAVAALLLQADPNATPTEIYNALRNTAERPSSGFEPGYGFGLIRADKAVLALGVQPQSVPEPSGESSLLIFGAVGVVFLLKRNQTN